MTNPMGKEHEKAWDWLRGNYYFGDPRYGGLRELLSWVVVVATIAAICSLPFVFVRMGTYVPGAVYTETFHVL